MRIPFGSDIAKAGFVLGPSVISAVASTTGWFDQGTSRVLFIVAVAWFIGSLVAISYDRRRHKAGTQTDVKPASVYPINIGHELDRRELVAEVESRLSERLADPLPSAPSSTAVKRTGGARLDVESEGPTPRVEHGFSGAVGRMIVRKCGFEAATTPEFNEHLWSAGAEESGRPPGGTVIRAGDGGPAGPGGNVVIRGGDGGLGGRGGDVRIGPDGITRSDRAQFGSNKSSVN